MRGSPETTEIADGSGTLPSHMAETVKPEKSGSPVGPVVRSVETCVLCAESMGSAVSASESQPMHRSCALRSVLGGIGHLIAHTYWCDVRGDPDAGLTYRQSARMVDAYVQVVGVDHAVTVNKENP